ncbi:cysteinyl-tRNA synthetase [Hypnocyclicus thermotrophus]|uniref:Cysteinyl-tRNA synthetase n=1 Tax=Hypnocyclicus thermotrophus TaxID=1627895 RepID=A0AA46DZ61_9FUSO|nr:MJ1477/TM1410 family putative glycoside hydrolase [Hypnocyclicus thermotrophus]TDT71434.1 cysteinyl-tRNA synthetase [Hypnocyclicus thermotrophus]
MIILLLISLIFISCSGNDIKQNNDNNSWLVQYQNINIDDIIKSNYKTVIIDYSKDGSDMHSFTKSEIDKLKNHNIKVISYLSIGEAEDYRFYWKNSWNTKYPIWIKYENPDWKGNYKVEYWNKEWENIIYIYLDKILKIGFDGVYLDVIDAYKYLDSNINYNAEKMIEFIEKISIYTKSKNPNFLIIPQNSEDLLKYDKENKFLNSIDGVGVESLWFYKNKPQDKKNTDYRLKFLRQLQSKGKFIYVIEYINKNIYTAKQLAIKNNFYYYIAKPDSDLDEIN